MASLVPAPALPATSGLGAWPTKLLDRLLDGARPPEAPAGTILHREGDAPRCGALLARLAFPLDDRWHALYGIDVPPCAPFHVMIVGGWGWSASPT